MPMPVTPARLRATVLLAALACAPLATRSPAQTPASPAPNADSTPIVLQAYTVTSVRASLASAQELKQESLNFIDSIQAQDVGKFPDNTVVDALSRIPGVQVSYTTGEFSGVVIRGLPNIETTLNGYEVFTGTGRGVALQDLPAEMIAGLDVYKSTGADKIEGGIAGLIDVRLHRPFDFAGPAFAVTARGYRSSQAQSDSYNLSFLASDRWKTAGGEFGALVDVSDSHQRYEDQIADNYVHFGANGEQFDLATDAAGNRGYYADNYGFQVIPGTRSRPAVSAMLQWRNDRGLSLYWDNLFTHYQNTNDVNFFIAIPSFGGFRQNVTLFPTGVDGYTVPEKFDATGAPARFVSSLQAVNTNTIASKQAFRDSTDGYQGAVGGSYDFGAVRLDSELSYDFTTVHTRGAILDTIIITPLMSLTYHDNAPTDVALSGIDYTNPANYHLSQYFDQWDRDHSVQYAWRTDATVVLHGWLTALKFGVRYSDRNVNSHSANPGSHGLPFSTLSSSIPGLMTPSESNLFVSSSQLNVRQWSSGRSSFLLDNASLDLLRGLAGQPLGLPAPDPSRTFTDEEQNFATYGLGTYHADLGGLALDGQFGVRFTDLHQSLGGFQRQTVNGSTTGAFVPATASEARWNALPTANGRLKLADKVYLRGAFTKTVTRPSYASLNPAVSLTSPGPTLQGAGAGGNPNLSPITSTNYDLAVEYYPSKSNQMTVAGFYRTIEGYVQNYADPEVIGGSPYSITRPQSTHHGVLSGAEATWTQFFDFLPDALKGLGVQLNYTYIEGHTENPLTNASTPLAQVSKNNGNAVLIYERGKVSVRLAYSWRDRYIDSFNQPGIQPSTVWVQPLDRLDLSGSYQLNANLTLTVDATNLLGHKYHDNFGNLPVFTRDIRSYDKTYGVGLRYHFY